jgi:hypothetical protein
LRNDVSTTETILNGAAVHISSSLCGSSGSPNNVFGYGRLDIKTAVDVALLHVISVVPNGANMVINFYGAAGKTYRLERNLDLTNTTTWQSIPGVLDVTPSTTGTVQIIDPGGANLTKAFYRVRWLP